MHHIHKDTLVFRNPLDTVCLAATFMLMIMIVSNCFFFNFIAHMQAPLGANSICFDLLRIGCTTNPQRMESLQQQVTTTSRTAQVHNKSNSHNRSTASQQWVAVDMNIHGYIHVLISDMGCPMDISMDICAKIIFSVPVSPTRHWKAFWWGRHAAHKAAKENVA